MKRKTAKDFDPELLDLYDKYAHDVIDRRQFLEKAGKFAVSGFSALAILKALSPHYALANQVPSSDDSITSEYIQYNSPKGYGEVKAYMAKPVKDKDKLGAVVVIHENRV